MIPGALKASTKNSKAIPATLCGGAGGLASATGTDGITICCKFFIFKVLTFYIISLVVPTALPILIDKH
jgi:hypothetical protein